VLSGPFLDPPIKSGDVEVGAGPHSLGVVYKGMDEDPGSHRRGALKSGKLTSCRSTIEEIYIQRNCDIIVALVTRAFDDIERHFTGTPHA
jgi:hypothetical protein